MSETLYEIVKKKADLEEQLEDYDTYSEELEKVWQDNEITLAEKVDAYGYVIDDIANKKNFLKAKYKRIKEAIDKFEKNEEAIKTRLHQVMDVMDVDVIKGNEYNFKKWNSVTHSVNPDEVPLGMKKYNVVMPSEIVPDFVKWVETNYFNPEVRIQYDKPIIPTVTQLPKNHPAIIEKVTPSVRRVK